jgi:hypothetical protein
VTVLEVDGKVESVVKVLLLELVGGVPVVSCVSTGNVMKIKLSTLWHCPHQLPKMKCLGDIGSPGTAYFMREVDMEKYCEDNT